MKLKNKKTGEIINKYPECFVINSGEQIYHYDSIAELNEEWEDYEEPKNFWYIDDFMIMCGTEGEFTTPDLGSFTEKDIEKLKAIGNYFETKEEAEKAVKKLKAWKRLKDKGIFIYLDHTDFQLQEGSFNFEFKNNLTNEEMNEADKDLDLLFGGEE